MIDSHCHLDHEPLFKKISEVLKNAKENQNLRESPRCDGQQSKKHNRVLTFTMLQPQKY